MYGYTPYYGNPMPDQLAQLRQNQMMQQPIQGMPQQMPQPQTAQNGINWVQGEAAAKSFPVAPGAIVTLWDSEQPVIYVKSADNTGMPTMRIMDYTERVQATRMPQNVPNAVTQDYVTREEFAALAARVEEYESKKQGKKTEEVKNG